MRTKILFVAVFAMGAFGAASAQDIAGDWQGTLKAGQDLRVIFHLEKNGDGSWTGKMYSIDQGPDPIPMTSVTLEGSNLKVHVDWIRGAYEGKVSSDGNSIDGTWTQRRALPLQLRRATKETAWQRDPAHHTVQFVTVEPGVKLEVLDWGGTGRPVVMLAGLGNTAHVFDQFATKLVPDHHVYGITRRGFGESSVSKSGYSADRLGDDVLAVIDALKLDRPVLAGHSIAGEELSSVGTRHPDKIAGLVYLDAAYGYAYYDPARGFFDIDKSEVQRKLEQLEPMTNPHDREVAIRELLSDLPRLEKDLHDLLKDIESEPPQPAGQTPLPPPIPEPALAIIGGQQKYSTIHVPILAIYAVPHNRPGLSDDPVVRAKAEARDAEMTDIQAKAFEAGEPSARVVRLPHASHFVFESNEADVLREMKAFFATLP